MSTTLVLAVGFIKAGLWAATASMCWYRKRGLACAGFVLGAILTITRATQDADAPRTATVDITALAGIPLIALLFSSFLIAQSHETRARPRHWRP